MMSKQCQNENHDRERTEALAMTGDPPPQSLLSDSTNRIHRVSATIADPYQNSLCGAILNCIPTKAPAAVFTYIRHYNFQALQRSLDVYHQEIIRIRNDDGQSVLHLLTINTYPYKWVRLLMMRGCDMCAQDNDGYTAAHYAVERDDAEMLKALTMRFCTQLKCFSEQYINDVYEHGIQALSLRNQQGLTVFMLACYHGSIKCLQYLLELNINDAHRQDQLGDTCLHYAVARQNAALVELLLDKCQADVNGGDETRPSVLDVFQFNRDDEKLLDRSDADAIEQCLQSRLSRHRCRLRRKVTKRKRSLSNAEPSESNPVSVTDDDRSRLSPLDRARDFAQSALASKNQGDLLDARENYRRAMECLPNDVLERATYASSLAMIHMDLGEHSSALHRLQEALAVRKRFEQDTDEVHQLQRSIDQIQQSLASHDRYSPSRESNQ